MSHLVEGFVLKDNGRVRPFVPVHVKYACHPCGPDHLHDVPMLGLVDSGADQAIMPASLLPEHVAWGDLVRTSARMNDQETEIRIWHAELYVFGVLIARDILVEDRGPKSIIPYAVLGLADVFRSFRISFAWTNVPPIFTLEPVGQITPQARTYTRVLIQPGPELKPPVFATVELPDGARMLPRGIVDGIAGRPGLHS